MLRNEKFNKDCLFLNNNHSPITIYGLKQMIFHRFPARLLLEPVCKMLVVLQARVGWDGSALLYQWTDPSLFQVSRVENDNGEGTGKAWPCYRGRRRVLVSLLIYTESSGRFTMLYREFWKGYYSLQRVLVGLR